jgi:hypothetical protein
LDSEDLTAGSLLTSPSSSPIKWVLTVGISLFLITFLIATAVVHWTPLNQSVDQKTSTSSPAPLSAETSSPTASPTRKQLEEACAALKKPVEILAIPMTYEEAEVNWPKIWVALGIIEDSWVHTGIPVSELRIALQNAMDKPDSASVAAALYESLVDIMIKCKTYGIEIDLYNQTFERQGY